APRPPRKTSSTMPYTTNGDATTASRPPWYGGGRGLKSHRERFKDPAHSRSMSSVQAEQTPSPAEVLARPRAAAPVRHARLPPARADESRSSRHASCFDLHMSVRSAQAEVTRGQAMLATCC